MHFFSSSRNFPGTICSGSMWEVDVVSLKPVARLVSPALDDLLGDSFGVQGQVYVTPDERCALGFVPVDLDLSLPPSPFSLRLPLY